MQPVNKSMNSELYGAMKRHLASFLQPEHRRNLFQDIYSRSVATEEAYQVITWDAFYPTMDVLLKNICSFFTFCPSQRLEIEVVDKLKSMKAFLKSGALNPALRDTPLGKLDHYAHLQYFSDLSLPQNNALLKVLVSELATHCVDVLTQLLPIATQQRLLLPEVSLEQPSVHVQPAKARVGQPISSSSQAQPTSILRSSRKRAPKDDAHQHNAQGDVQLEDTSKRIRFSHSTLQREQAKEERRNDVELTSSETPSSSADDEQQDLKLGQKRTRSQSM